MNELLIILRVMIAIPLMESLNQVSHLFAFICHCPRQIVIQSCGCFGTEKEKRMVLPLKPLMRQCSRNDVSQSLSKRYSK